MLLSYRRLAWLVGAARTGALRGLVPAFAFGATVALFGAGSASAGSSCDRFAGPRGHDHGRGSAGRPFRTAQRLANSLRPGQRGCLLSGVYNEDLRFNHGGFAGAPITLSSAPGHHASIVGRVYIPKTSSYVRVVDLRLDGRNSRNLPSPSVDSANDQFLYDDVTDDHTGICFMLGSSGGYGAAVHALLAHNRIHDCGLLPPTNHQHGIYAGNTYGARIVDNIIYNNADRGIQLYWNAQRTTIAGNIIDHNGMGVDISGASGFASSHNLIVNNVITNSTVRADVGSWWPQGNALGVGNLVAGNCVFGGRWTIDGRSGGFTAIGNLRLNPRYADASAGDYRLPSESRCARILVAAPLANAHRYGLIDRAPH
jgi:Right handed beta helix region